MVPEPSAQSVSILLPNYNHARFVDAALDALAAQTRAPEEIIVVDDCSTDDSIQRIQRFEARLPQLRLLRNMRNVGVNMSLNRALGEARGNYVVCTAADDRLMPTFIERATAVLSQYPQKRLCVSRYAQYLESEERLVEHGVDSQLGFWFTSTEPEYVAPQRLRNLLDHDFVWLPINTAIIHRDTLCQIGGFDPALRWHADWFAAYTIGLRHGVLFIPESLSVFRVARHSYSGAGMRSAHYQRQVALAIYDKIRRPEYSDIGEILRRHPVAFSPFLRPLMLGLATRPQDWPYLASISRWWLNEARRGRRPGLLRDVVGALRSVVGLRTESGVSRTKARLD
jgi:glycosyltransferase involved in cell wall biosynthesis